jgi:DNA-binding MarR family transcriptional regulator
MFQSDEYSSSLPNRRMNSPRETATSVHHLPVSSVKSIDPPWTGVHPDDEREASPGTAQRNLKAVVDEGGKYGYIPAYVAADSALSLAEDYVGCVAGHLRAAARVITREYDAALRPHGLRITQVAILARLADLQPVTLTAFADALAGDRSAVARDIAILERAGFVASAPNTEDKRARDLSLTRAGLTKLSECAPAWHATQAMMRERLGDADAAALVALSDRVVSALTR